MFEKVSRRSLLRFAGGLGSLVGSAAMGRQLRAVEPPGHGATAHAGHGMGTVGRVSTERFDPHLYLRSWNFSHLPADERQKHYRETVRPDGTRLREYDIFAVDRELEIAPGVFFAAWTYNGQVPGPTIRATEGDRVRVNFINQGSHPHS